MGEALSAPDPLQPKMSCARLLGITTLELRDYADERERLFDRDQVSFDWQHYIPFIERKSCALRTHNKRVRF